MRVDELMTRNPITVKAQTGVLEARHLMVEKQIRHLLVVGPDGGLVGIVTDRDIRLDRKSVV